MHRDSDLPFLIYENSEESALPFLPELERSKDENGWVVYEIDEGSTRGRLLRLVHSRYVIDDADEPECARLIQAYLRALHVYRKSFELTEEDSSSFRNFTRDLEFDLFLQLQDLAGLVRSIRELDEASCRLGRFLQGRETRGSRVAPPWMLKANLQFDPNQLF